MADPEGAEVPGNSQKQEKPRRPAAATAKPAKAKPAKAQPSKPRAPAKRKPAEPAHSRAGHGWIWTALVALALASGGSVASLWFLQGAARHAQTQHLEALVRAASPAQLAQAQDRKIAALDKRLSDLESRFASIPDLSAVKEAEAATGLLSEKIDGLSGRLSEVEKGLARLQAAGLAGGGEGTDAAKAAAQELDSLKQRVAALEQAKQARVSTETIERNQALVVAVGQLREALASARPFASELSTVTALGDADVARITDKIASFADSGIPTVADLRERFPKMADAVVRAAGESKRANWIDKAIARAASVVTVRKVGPDVEGDTPDALLARAESRLAADDLDGALAEMSKLTGPPAAAAGAWMDKAKARATAEQALKDLHLHVIGQIAQSDGAAK